MQARSRARHDPTKDYLVKRIAWRLRAQEAGDLSERARRRAEQLANDADLRTTTPKHPTEDTAPGFTTRAATLPPTDPAPERLLVQSLVAASVRPDSKLAVRVDEFSPLGLQITKEQKRG